MISKKVKIIAVMLISVFAFNFKNKSITGYEPTKKYYSQNFSGTWNYEFNSDENELLNKTFELNLVQNKDILKGQYCAVVRGGRKIDCSDEKTYNISGKIKDNIAYVDFTGFYDTKANGKAKLYFVNGDLVWEILTEKGTIFAPKKVALKNKSNTKTNLEGLYVLKSCENSRFSVLIKKTLKSYSFCIRDKKKIIAQGITTTRNEDGNMVVTLGDLAGIYENKNTITIQNYGNSMNDYINFTQCSEKYLSFVKN